MYAVINMDGYKADDILRQALGLVEEAKDKGNIITKTTYLYQFYFLSKMKVIIQFLCVTVV